MPDLTETERAQLDDYLSHPLQFPPEFKNWLSDWLAVNTPQLSVNQLLGYKGTLANSSVVNNTENVNSAWAPERTWVDLPTYGPEVKGLADGTYFVSWGGMMARAVVGGATCRIGLSVNGADPVRYVQYNQTDPAYPGWRALVQTIANNDNNALRLKYYYDLGGGASASFQQRWLTVIRIT